MQTALQREACTKLYHPLHWMACLHCVSAIWASPDKGGPRILFHPVLRLSPSNQSCFFTNRSEHPHSDQSKQCLLDQSNSEDLEPSFAIRDKGQRHLVYISQLPDWLWEHTFPFHWSLCFLSWSWTTKDVCQSKVEQTSTGQSRAEQSNWRGSWAQGCFTGILFYIDAVSQLNCFTLNKVSFFTAPQIQDSCWLWHGTNDCQLT